MGETGDVKGQRYILLDDDGHPLCGCGGVGEPGAFGGIKGDWIECHYCGIRTDVFDSEAEAWSVWDTAFGGKR